MTTPSSTLSQDTAPATATPRLIAALVAVLAFLPIVNWIPGGHSAPWYHSVLQGWLSGSAIAVGVGIVLTILSRRIGALWRPGSLDGVVAFWEQRPLQAGAVIALGALAMYLWAALHVLSGRPLLIDELVQVLQAQMYAHGHLWRPVFSHPEFFSSMHVVDTHGKYYSQFPAGGPAMLTLGVLLGAPWLVGPVCGAVGVIAFAIYVRRTEARAGTALLATLVFACAPFAVFMSGSHMNHVTALMWVAVAMAAMAPVMTSDTPRPWLALASGFGFGMAGTIRPVDALAFALPAGMWFLVRALRDRRRWADALPAALGVAVPLAGLFWVNAQTTGAPLRFGYEVLWGKSHELGFHRAPWGMSHTPARGLELVNLYFLRLQSYFLETPIPSLVPAIAALALTKRLQRFDRYLLWASALLVGLYWAYWHDGFYLGPRFVYLLLLPLAIWTARFFPMARARWGALGYRATMYSTLCAMVIAVGVNVPIRTLEYERGMLTMRWDADAAAAKAGVRHALVFVRESWGAELVARMWAMGITRPQTELIYRHVDACVLDRRLTDLEHQGLRDSAAYAGLHPLLQDSAQVIGSPYSPDTTERYQPGVAYTADCVKHVDEDRQGFTLFTPLLLAHGGDNVYARDMGARDTVLLRAYPGRPLYLVRPATSAIGAVPRFYPLSRDSVEKAWGLTASAAGAAGAPATRAGAGASATQAPSSPVMSRAPRR